MSDQATNNTAATAGNPTFTAEPSDKGNAVKTPKFLDTVKEFFSTRYIKTGTLMEKFKGFMSKALKFSVISVLAAVVIAAIGFGIWSYFQVDKIKNVQEAVSSSLDVQKAKTSELAQTLAQAQEKIKALEETYIIETGAMNAHFSKKYYFFGTPEIVFQSPTVEGTLSALGDLEMEVNVPNGPQGVISGKVTMEQAFLSKHDGTYSFHGNGISGSFIIIYADATAYITDFNAKVDWEVIQK